MTYAQLWDGLSAKDKFICRALTLMKTNEAGKWDLFSIWNRMVYKFLKMILGVDPFDRVLFWGKCLECGLLGETVQELKDELWLLKLAYDN